MIAKVTIDIDEAFDSLGNDESGECVSNFYEALPHRHQPEIIAQIIEDADDDVLIGELERRGYNIKKDD